MSNSTSFLLNEFTGSDAQVEVTLTEVPQEPNVVQVSLKVVKGYIADAVGFFAEFNDLTVNNNFTITAVDSDPGSLLTVGTQTGAGLLYLDDSGSTIDGIGDLDNNVNLNGQGIQRDYALGVQIGEGGLKGGDDDYQEVTFKLSAAGLSVSNFSKIGMRLQSVGDDREGSSKLEGIPDNGTETPSVAISKVTNGKDGQTILAGQPITWTYQVTNTGNVDLSDIEVTDDKEGFITTLVSGDISNIGVLDTDETWVYEATGIAVAGEYSNIGTVTADYKGTPITATDPSNYFGADPKIAIDKVTNGKDGQTILAGQPITWTYKVTNEGNVALSNITVDDDQEGVITTRVSGDSNENDLLDTDETWIYEATGTAVAGEYTNKGTVKGSFTDDLGNTETPESDDLSDYFGANPGIAIDKVTNGADGQTILAGTEIKWTYTVTNEGNVALSNITVDDDQEGVITTRVSGDSNENDLLDTDETWIYEATGTAVAGEYTNKGTVKGSFTDDLGNTETPESDDLSDYFGANPGIAIDKVTDNGAVQGDGLLIQEKSAIDWIYTVTNTGNVGLSSVVVTDNDSGVTPIAVDQDGHPGIDGDLNSDGILDIGETWVYKASGTAIKGAYENTGTVTASFTDELGNIANPTDSDDSSYHGVPIAGARTPGFWKNWKQAWDGNASNDHTFVGRENFAGGDVLLAPYTAATTDPVTGDKTTGLLIGDYNRNGTTDAGENTIFYTLEEAHKLVDASKKDDHDVRFILGRSMVASWLNFLAVNPTPKTDINDGIKWMQTYTPKGDGDVFNGGAIQAKSDAWSGDIEGRNGSEINAALDYYNNTGSFGTQLIV
ncbi:hypothetical protein NG791_00725 [Laspinema sp. D1]|uniref:DUF7507 domain-containing protein n=1 Tax=Laspinema palackyanum TaxID=3231601 RepID=UPI0034892AD0|nr:hypothetical protein [Laspinema sp. D2b]